MAASGLWQDMWADGSGEMFGAPGAAAALETHWRTFFERAKLPAGALVLDVASGSAFIAAAASASGHADRSPQFVCLDYAPAALAHARRKLGRWTIPVAGDAMRLPFAKASFAAVVSQFGIEYAGASAFAASAQMLQPGGAFCAVVHARDGVLDLECAENARACDAFRKAGAIEKARAALNASLSEPQRPGAKGYLNKKKEAAFERSVAEARAQLAVSAASTARPLLAQYTDDIERLLARRFAFAPEDALGWLASVEARLAAYRDRMSAMTEAALTLAELQERASALRAEGCEGIAIEDLAFRAGEARAAWILAARRRLE